MIIDSEILPPKPLSIGSRLFVEIINHPLLTMFRVPLIPTKAREQIGDMEAKLEAAADASGPSAEPSRISRRRGSTGGESTE